MTLNVNVGEVFVSHIAEVIIWNQNEFAIAIKFKTMFGKEMIWVHF